MNHLKEFIEYITNAFKIWVIVLKWESGIRVRMGKKVKKLDPGIHFKIPYLDSVYVMENRLRVSTLSMQTLTSKDGKTITVDSALGYSIDDVEKLFNTLFQPEITLANICKSAVSDYIQINNLEDITPISIEKHVLEVLKTHKYGLDYKYYKITNFAVVRTFRLIQDGSWNYNGLKMDEKK